MDKECLQRALEYGEAHKMEARGPTGNVFLVSAAEAYMRGWADKEASGELALAEKNAELKAKSRELSAMTKKLSLAKAAIEEKRGPSAAKTFEELEALADSGAPLVRTFMEQIKARAEGVVYNNGEPLSKRMEDIAYICDLFLGLIESSGEPSGA